MYELRETIRQSFADALVARREARISSSTHASLADYVIHLSEVERYSARPYPMHRLTHIDLTNFEKTVRVMRWAPEVFREFLVPRKPTFEQAVHFVVALEDRLRDPEEGVAAKKPRIEQYDESASRCKTPPRKEAYAPGWYCY